MKIKSSLKSIKKRDLNSKIKKISARKGERYASALTKLPKKDKIIIKYGKISLKDYISSFIKPSWKLKVH